MSEVRSISTASAWCWQDKAVMRIIRENFSGKKLTTAVAIYQSFTELASNNECDIFNAYYSQISKLAGKSVSTIKIYCKDFIRLRLIEKKNRKLDGRTNLSNEWILLSHSVNNNYPTSSNNGKQTSVSNSNLFKEQSNFEKKEYELPNFQKNHLFNLRVKAILRQKGARVS